MNIATPGLGLETLRLPGAADLPDLTAGLSPTLAPNQIEQLLITDVADVPKTPAQVLPAITYGEVQAPVAVAAIERAAKDNRPNRVAKAASVAGTGILAASASLLFHASPAAADPTCPSGSGSYSETVSVKGGVDLGPDYSGVKVRWNFVDKTGRNSDSDNPTAGSGGHVSLSTPVTETAHNTSGTFTITGPNFNTVNDKIEILDQETVDISCTPGATPTKTKAPVKPKPSPDKSKPESKPVTPPSKVKTTTHAAGSSAARTTPAHHVNPVTTPASHPQAGGSSSSREQVVPPKVKVSPQTSAGAGSSASRATTGNVVSSPALTSPDATPSPSASLTPNNPESAPVLTDGSSSSDGNSSSANVMPNSPVAGNSDASSAGAVLANPNTPPAASSSEAPLLGVVGGTGALLLGGLAVTEGRRGWKFSKATLSMARNLIHGFPGGTHTGKIA